MSLHLKTVAAANELFCVQHPSSPQLDRRSKLGKTSTATTPQKRSVKSLIERRSTSKADTKKGNFFHNL